MEVAASALLSTALTASAGLQLRRNRPVVAHVCGIMAALVPLIMIPASNPLRTVSFAGALAYLYSIHGLDRVLRKHRPAYEAWCRGDVQELPAKAARFKALFESDLTIAQHLTGEEPQAAETDGKEKEAADRSEQAKAGRQHRRSAREEWRDAGGRRTVAG